MGDISDDSASFSLLTEDIAKHRFESLEDRLLRAVSTISEMETMIDDDGPGGQFFDGQEKMSALVEEYDHVLERLYIDCSCRVNAFEEVMERCQEAWLDESMPEQYFNNIHQVWKRINLYSDGGFLSEEILGKMRGYLGHLSEYISRWRTSMNKKENRLLYQEGFLLAGQAHVEATITRDTVVEMRSYFKSIKEIYRNPFRFTLGLAESIKDATAQLQYLQDGLGNGLA
ncbi:MAG: hypothetical protein ABIC95_03790 [archaeon]